MDNIWSRFPKTDDMLQVYSLVVFLEYTWAMLAFFYTLTSWLLMLSLADIAWSFFYGIFFTFLDSLVVFSLALICAWLAPSKWLRDEFLSRGGMLAMALFAWIVLLQAGFAKGNFFLAILIVVLHIGAMVFLTARVPILKRFVEGFISRAALFAYIYLPLSVVGFFVILLRNVAG